MMRTVKILAVSLTAFVTAADTLTTIDRVYCDDSGTVHVVESNGNNETAKKEFFSDNQKQADAVQMKVSSDKRTAGWIVEFSGIGASYPIGIMLDLWRDGKVIQRFTEVGGYMFERWLFTDLDRNVAFEQDPIHGPDPVIYEVRDINTSKLVRKWDPGKSSKNAPQWVKDLQK